MALTEAERLRQLLGETVPADGSDDDTLFTHEEVQDFLNESETTEAAAYLGWRAKWAQLSNLANTAAGTARDELGSLAAQAKTQMDYYGNLSGVAVTTSRTRIGRIVR